MQPDQRGLVGKSATTGSRCRRGRPPPRRRAAAARRGPRGRTSRGRSPLAGHHLGPLPQVRRPGRDHVVDRASPAVHVRKRASPPSSATPSRSSWNSSTSTRLSSGESTMPWSATTSSRIEPGQGLAQVLGLGVDHRQLLQPLDRGDSVAVPRPVQVAVVQVGQRGTVVRRRDGRRDPLADLVRPDVRRPAVRGHGQPAGGERTVVHHGDRRPRRIIRANAVGCGCHSSGSTSRSHSSAFSSRSVPGTREVKPTRPWAPGVRPVPSEVRLVAVVDGTPAVPGTWSSSRLARYGAACA